jgi:type II secretory pathway pseudopilin PulG
MLIVIVLLGILAVGVGQVFGGTRAAALERDAVERAMILNTAKQTYKLRVTNASASFTGTDAAKYSLLQPYIPMSPATLGGFTPAGYSYTLNGLDTPVAVSGPNGNVSY